MTEHMKYVIIKAVLVTATVMATALLFPRYLCAQEVVSFVRHNGLVTELLSMEQSGTAPPRNISYTASSLLYDLVGSDDRAAKDAFLESHRKTTWTREGDTITVYDEAGTPFATMSVDVIEYKEQGRDANKLMQSTCQPV